ncbi:MAG: aminotransferase class V-fold PLP-dependent enzyme [Anaerolineales bacterium]|nr:aminotransferase class V-fold PLP-dependent enzyme [Anaerolineales bacterium]
MIMDIHAFTDLDTPERLLLGPGPSMVHPRVLRVMTHPLTGHLDPAFLNTMNEIQEMLRHVFQTKNWLTFPVAGTGSAGMEAMLCNLIEPGDHVLICVNGFFGTRMVEMAGRYGAQVRRIERRWGEVFTPEEIDTALKSQPAKLVALVHAETSTGALQPLEGIADIVHHHGGLLLVDCVTSLGGLPVSVDTWDVDAVFSGSQKALSAPPGLAPLTFGERAVEALHNRKTKVANWYLDLSLLEQYWGEKRAYHHTAPISTNYAMREALRIALEEGLDNRFARHRMNAELLWEGLNELGLGCHVPIEHRLPTLTTVTVPDNLDEAKLRTRLLNEYNIEIGGGLGMLKGHVVRVGLMGHSSKRENVTTLLGALRELLPSVRS